MIATEGKQCSVCSQWKQFSEFNRDKAKSDGYYTVCKECKKEKLARWREQNQEYIKQYGKEYRAKPDHKEKKIARRRAREFPKQRKARWEQSKDAIIARMRTAEAEAIKAKRIIKRLRKREVAPRAVLGCHILVDGVTCKECKGCGDIKRLSEFHKNGKAKDGRLNRCKECELQFKKRWRDSNREMYNAHHRQRAAIRREDPQYRLHKNISTRIRGTIVNKGGRQWERLVPYTFADLTAHLEKQFRPGMTWDNYGQWHIDHIRPVSSFEFQSYKDEQFQQCWALENLQPLWADENYSKGASLDWGLNKAFTSKANKGVACYASADR